MSEGLGVGLHAFSKAFDKAYGTSPHGMAKKLSDQAEAKRIFEESPEGVLAQRRSLDRQALFENEAIKRELAKDKSSILHSISLNYKDDNSLAVAMSDHMEKQDLSSLKQFANRTVNNNDFSGFFKADDDYHQSEAARVGGATQLGNSNWWYHSPKVLAGKVHKAHNQFGVNIHLVKKQAEKENSNLSPVELRKSAFDMLTPDQQVLYDTQHKEFNNALDATVRNNIGDLIVPQKEFRKQLNRLQRKEQNALTHAEKTSHRNAIKRIQTEMVEARDQGYGYTVEEYKYIMRRMLGRSVGELGLVDQKQIERFMSGFFADEKNVSRFRRELLKQFGTTKKLVSTPTISDVSTKSIKEARVNTRLGG